jgi:hypothetical protein
MLNLFTTPEKGNYRFKEPKNTACFTCDHVLNNGKPILYVSHDQEGDWQFLCGQNNHTEVNAKIISLEEVTELDPSVNDLFEMPMGVGAERDSKKDKWTPFKLQD